MNVVSLRLISYLLIFNRLHWRGILIGSNHWLIFLLLCSWNCTIIIIDWCIFAVKFIFLGYLILGRIPGSGRRIREYVVRPIPIKQREVLLLNRSMHHDVSRMRENVLNSGSIADENIAGSQRRQEALIDGSTKGANILTLIISSYSSLRKNLKFFIIWVINEWSFLRI